jgi:hypothetical protein
VEFLSPVSLDEVAAVWLGAEIDSDRFGATVRALLKRDRQPAALLTAPDLTDEQANAARMDLLREYRGFDQPDPSIETCPALGCHMLMAQNGKFCAAAAAHCMRSAFTPRRRRLVSDQAFLQGQPGQLGSPPQPALVADAVQVRPDGADTDV